MEIGMPEFKDWVLGGVLAFLGWIWRLIRGDIIAARKAAEIVAATTVKKDDFKDYLNRSEKARDEFLSLFKDMFQQMKDHSENDNKMFMQITISLAKLEERTNRKE